MPLNAAWIMTWVENKDGNKEWDEHLLSEAPNWAPKQKEALCSRGREFLLLPLATASLETRNTDLCPVGNGGLGHSCARYCQASAPKGLARSGGWSTGKKWRHQMIGSTEGSLRLSCTSGRGEDLLSQSSGSCCVSLGALTSDRDVCCSQLHVTNIFLFWSIEVLLGFRSVGVLSLKERFSLQAGFCPVGWEQG